MNMEGMTASAKTTMVSVSKIGSDSLVMNWTSSNATSWDVKVSTVAMTDMTQNGNVQNITVTSNPAVISGLTPLTSYYIYIRSNCGVGDVSEWSNAILAKTSCVAISSFPYVESFEDEGDGTFPACWFRPKSYEYNSVVSPNVSYVNISGSDKSLQLRSSAYGSIYAVSPALNCELNELMVSFVMKYSTTYYQGTIEVGIMSNPYDLSTYVPVKSFTPVNTDVADYSVMLDNVTLGGIGNYVAFRFSSESSGAYAYIDDIEIDSIPSCVTPSNVRMKTIMPTSAVVGWNAQGNENSWNVKISSKYMSRPSTAVGDVFEGSVTTDSILISNLKMGLTYYGAVQAICSDGSSLWERFTFTTICGDISELPYIEDFSDYGFGTSVFVPCWWSFVSSHPYISSAYNNTAGKSNSGSLYFVPTSSRPLLIAATPEINVPGYQISDMLVSFSMRAEGAKVAFIIGVMSNTDTASFVAVDTVCSSGLGFESFEVYFNEYTGSGK